MARPKKPEAAIDGGFAKVASIDGVSPKDVKTLLAEIADLKEKLHVETAARSDAEKIALASAESQGVLMQREIQEVLTGRTVKTPKCKGYKVVGHKDDGRDILKPVFEQADVPTYFYKIDMPPVGGVDLKINGTSMYHGTVVELDLDTLRSVKEIIFRLWDHDRNIHGSDENFYRKPNEQRLSAR